MSCLDLSSWNDESDTVPMKKTIYKIHYEEKDFYPRPEIKKVIFNDPATIVFWDDGTKTVVKCENEKFDPEKGLAMAIAKMYFGNIGSYYNIFKKYIYTPEEERISITIDNPYTRIFSGIADVLNGLNNKFANPENTKDDV